MQNGSCHGPVPWQILCNMDNVIGRNLKVMREANDLTQEQMASYLGIGRSAYANYEAGERETPLEVLERSASLSGCELPGDDSNIMLC